MQEDHFSMQRSSQKSAIQRSDAFNSGLQNYVSTGAHSGMR